LGDRILIKDEEQIKCLREECMFEVTEKAGEMIKESLRDKDPIPSIRVVYNEGG
jgi:hypothetical protein